MKKLLLTFTLATLLATGVTQEVNAAPKKVKLTYVENGGKSVKDQSVSKNTNPKEPSITREGYTFMGWYTNKGMTKKWNVKTSKATKNTTLYAKWKKGYKVTYVENGGNTAKDQYVGLGANPTEPLLTRKGYTFAGWYTDKALTNKWNAASGLVTDPLTLYAKWTEGTTDTKLTYGPGKPFPSFFQRVGYGSWMTLNGVKTYWDMYGNVYDNDGNPTGETDEVWPLMPYDPVTGEKINYDKDGNRIN